jgi:hypothetical protein
VKPAKLFTMHTRLVLKKPYALGPEKLSMALNSTRRERMRVECRGPLTN